MEDKILLAHGSGGRLSHELIEKVFVPHFQGLNAGSLRLDDAAVTALSSLKPPVSDLRLAFTTDSYVVKPLFFNGGDIGYLAVCGTVNDLSMVGARPLYISCAFVLEEGLPMATLEQVVQSMRRAAAEAGVQIVTGDTKVVEQGGADQLFVNTAGLGVVASGLDISGSNARPGDVVLLSGYIGDHGIAVLSRREGLEFGTQITSDIAPLNHLVEAMLGVSKRIHVLRDPTRGGLATTLNEIARQSQVGVCIYEEAIPVRDEVQAACDMLGYDPLYVANEGKLVAFVAPDDAEAVLQAMRATSYGQEARIIGEAVGERKGKVAMKTRVGGTRVVDMLTGEMLPRIC